MSISSAIAHDVHIAHHKVKSKRTSMGVQFAHMSTKLADQDVARRLVEARINRKLGDAKATARYFGWTYFTYIQHENGTRGIKRDVAERYAKALKVSVAWLLTGVGSQEGSRIPIIGFAGAGGEARFEPLPGDDYIEASAPAGTVAVKIRGSSLGPGFDGWYALYNERRNPFSDDLYGKLCVVGTEDGRTLIKWARRAPLSGVNLMSGTGDIEENVNLTWAAPVIELKPTSDI